MYRRYIGGFTMKRTLAVLLAVLMIFGCAALTACNKTGLVNDRDDAK